MPSQPMDLDQLIEKAHLCLAQIIKCTTPDPETQPAHFFAHSHSARLYRLGGELDRAVEAGGVFSPPIVARAMLESLFKLGIVAGPKPNRLTLALEKAVQELEWEMIQELFASPKTSELHKIRLRPDYHADIEPTVKNYRSRWGLSAVITPACEVYLTTWWCASNAGMQECYNEDYRILSKAAHALASDFLSTSVTYSRRASARIMIEASRCLTTLFPTKVPVVVVGEVNDCWKAMSSKEWVHQFMSTVALETFCGINHAKGSPLKGTALN